MRRPIFAVLALSLWFGSVSTAQAQNALERLEELLRRNPDQPQPAERVEPGYLGAVADDRDEKGRGVRVMKVAEGGPAAQAGLRERDLITAIDGRPVRSMAEMGRHLEATTPGARMVFDVERDARTIRFPVVLGARPAAGAAGRLFQDFGRIADPNAPAQGEVPPPEPRAADPRLDPRAEAQPGRGVLLGIRTSSVILEDQIRLRLPTAQGARITEITANSPAERAGLRLNDFIVAVDNSVVRVPADLSQRIAQAGPGKTVELGFYRAGQFFQMKVRLASEEPREQLPPAQGALRPPLDPRRPMDDKARIEMLEQAVGELLLRVQQLEAEVAKHRPNVPPKPVLNRGAEIPPPEPGSPQ
jgi:membrane-associated protease RseP (regulator of RpoE activity)